MELQMHDTWLKYCAKYEERTHEELKAKYQERALRTVANLLPVLKNWGGMSTVTRYLDIGCGNGAVTAAVAQALRVSEVFMIDGDGTKPRTSAWTTNGVAWNDVHAAMAMVSENVAQGVIVAGMFAEQPDYEMLPRKIGLITSFRSWGHHYPVDVYLPLVKKHLMHGGLVVLDIRNKTNGKELMQRAGYRYLATVPDQSAKCARLLFTNA